MKEANGSSTSADSENADSDEAVTERQLKYALDHLQLQLKSLSYDTLDGNQKVNLLAIRTLGIVYSLITAIHLITAVIIPRVTFETVITQLQTTLVLFIAFYGLVMFLTELAGYTIGPELPLSDHPDTTPDEQ